MKENVFLKKNSKLSQYIPVPSNLINGKLGSTTLIIYGTLISRALLSMKNGWVDDSGNVYVRYTNNNLATDTGKSISTVKESLKELEANDLIVRKRIDATTKNIYVKVPSECVGASNLATERSENKPVSGQKTGFVVDGKSATNKYNKRFNISNKYVRQEGESF